MDLENLTFIGHTAGRKKQERVSYECGCIAELTQRDITMWYKGLEIVERHEHSHSEDVLYIK